MTDNQTPFNHRPDPVVGAALRQALATTDDAAFVARVLAAAARPLARSPVEILAGWARPGIAAAVVAALIAGYVVGRDLAAPRESLDEAMVAAFSSDGPPDGSVAFATFIEP